MDIKFKQFVYKYNKRRHKEQMTETSINDAVLKDFEDLCIIDILLNSFLSCNLINYKWRGCPKEKTTQFK